MTEKRCKDYGLKCLQCPHWNKWSNYCTKWKITISTSGDGMSEKRFTILSSSIDYYEYWDTKEEKGLTKDEVVELLNALHEENIALKYKNELLQDELKQCKAVIDNKWSEYLKEKELICDD